NTGPVPLLVILTCMSVLTSKAPTPNATTSKRPTEPPEPANICSFHSVLPEDVLEAELLKESIAWPETPSLLPNFSLNDTSGSAHRSWRVGDQLEVLIQIADFHGRRKSSGGDVLLARLHNPTLFAGVAGRVLDHRNGSYTAAFSLLWEGSAQVEVTLVHPSEAVTVLERITQQNPDRVSLKGNFRAGSVTEATSCNVCLKAPPEKLCNFTDIRTGEPWFCYKPKKLKCEHWLIHSFGGFGLKLKPMEEKLFQSVFKNIVFDLDFLLKMFIFLIFFLTLGRGVITQPAGYYYQGIWRALDGSTVQQLTNNSAISQCLSGKVLHLYGDSTIRQWFEYLISAAPDLKKFDLKSLTQTGPFMALNYAKNTLVTFRCHAPPIRFGHLPISQIRYIANELDGVVGGENTVVVIGVWSHFSTFPVEVYIRRLLTIRRAVERLLTRAPGTLVIIRTANPKALSLYETLTNSDWFSIQRDKILRTIFKGVNVRFVDAWEMTLAHHLPHNLHPQLPIIRNMLNVVLSHICSPAGNFKKATKL
uniref:Neurexophilin and PC-esterase domain family member 3 n=1 Tax=Xiphophorus maculatus TaxID=8083 RepID=A0A3B5QAE3_XIPMA